MKRNAALFGIVAILFSAFGSYLNIHRPELAPPVLKLFAQSLPDVQGAPQALSQWKGKALIVNFWAPWCAPCVEEMPALSALQAEIAGKNVQILGLGVDTATHIADFSSRLKIGYPLYAAEIDGIELSRQFGNQSGGLPFTVLMSADGQIRKTYLGRLKLDELRRDLAAL